MKFKEKLGWVIGLLILLGGCLQSCVTERKVEKYLKKNPLFGAEWCDAKYPVKETFIKGKDSIIEKTVTVKGDSIPCPPNEKGEVVKVKCPDAKVITQDRWRIDTVVKENTAKLSALQQRYDDLDKKYTVEKDNRLEAEKKAKERLWWIWGICGAVIAFAVIKWKFFSF